MYSWRESRADGQETEGPWPIMELQPGARLTWEAEPGARYRIEKSTTLEREGEGAWKVAAFVETAGATGSWPDPEPAGQRAFYRLTRVWAEVKSIEPPLLSPNGGELRIYGSGVPQGASLRLEIEGAAPVVVPLTGDGQGGVWVARVEGNFTPGSLVMVTAIADAQGRTLLPLNQPLEVTETGRASDGPPGLPLAAPPSVQGRGGVFIGVGDLDGDGIAAVQDHNSSRSNKRERGSESYNPWEMDDSNDATVLNPLYQGSGNSGSNPMFESTKPVPGVGIVVKSNGKPSKGVTPVRNYVAINKKGTGADSQRTIPAGSGLPGEVSFHTIDLALDTPAGPALEWIGTYRSKRPLSSGHGPGWDFSYNISIEPMPVTAGPNAPRLRIHDGGGRADIFYRQPDGSYRADGFFREGRFDGETFTLTFADTGRWIFRPLDGSPAAGKIAAITDRNGVSLTCDYEAATGRLASVNDSFGRRLVVAWDGERVSTVTAEKGGAPLLRVAYTYTDGRKTAISCPFVPGTPPVAGPLTFAYVSGSPDPALNDNLLSITDGAGRLYEAFTYSSATDPRAVDYDTLATHDRHRGGHVTVLKFADAPSGTGAPGGYAIYENDELGRVTVSGFDRCHRPIRIREYTGFATPGQPVDVSGLPAAATKLRSSDPVYFETTIAWNADNLPIVITHPDGSREETIYDRDFRRDCPVRERGNARLLTLRAPGGEARSVSLSYLPNFGTPEAARPGGPIGGIIVKGGKNSSPSHGVTSTDGNVSGVDDWESPVIRAASINSVNNSMPNRLSMTPTTARQSQGQTFGEKVATGLQSGANALAQGTSRQSQGQTFGEKVTSRMAAGDPPRGFSTGKRQHKPYYFPTQITTAHGQSFTCTYDAHGNLTGETSPISGSGVQYEYNQRGQLTACTVLDGPGSSFRETYAYDPATGCPVSVSVDPGGLNLTTTFAHDALGRCVSVTDPLGHDWRFDYNPPGQIVATHSPEIAPDIRITTTATYDAGGFLARCDTAHLGPNAKPVAENPAYSTFYVYDGRGRLVRVAEEERPVDASGLLVPDSLGLENFAVCDIAYDPAGQIVRLSTPAASRGQADALVCDFTYDERGLPHRVIEGGAGHASAVVTECDYDATGAPVRITRVGGQGVAPASTLYAYDGFHRPSSVTDAMGNVASFAYDNEGRVTTSLFGELEDQPGSAGNVLLYSSTGKTRGRATMSDLSLRAQNNNTVRSNRSNSAITVLDDPDSDGDSVPTPGLRAFNQNASRSNHTRLGLTEGFDGSPAPGLRAFNQNASRSNRTRLSLMDSLFFDVFTTDDTLVEERFTPGTPGAPALETTVVHHSPAGLPLSVTRNGDTLLTFEYDTAARRKGWDGTVKGGSRIFDACGNVISEQSIDRFTANGQPGSQTFTRTYAYDPLGRCVQASDSVGNTAHFAWDSCDRLRTVTESGGVVIVLDYDGGTPASPFSTRVSTDVDGDGAPEVLSTAFARCGELLYVEDSAARRTAFTCDALGRVTRIDHPDDAYETIAYDSSGRATGKRQRSGLIVNYGYDALNRVVSIAHDPTSLPPGVEPVPPTAFAYRGGRDITYIGPCDASRLARVQQGDSVVAFTCDSLGNPLSETSDGSTITRAFDHRGCTAVSYSDGRAYSIARNAQGLPLTVSALDATGQPVSPPVVSHEYIGHRPRKSTLANGTVTTFTYRGDGDAPSVPGDLSFDACTEIVVTDTAGHELTHIVQQRDGMQRLTQTATAFAAAQQGQQPPGRVLILTRNVLGHVTGALTRHREAPGGPVITSEVAYTLDLEGRRLSVSGGANPGAYTQDAIGRYATWPGGPLEWDAENNLLSWSWGEDNSHGRLNYDAESRLVSVTNPGDGSVLVSYTYDALGRRKSRTFTEQASGDIVTTAFAFDGDTCVLETTAGATTKISDFGLSRLVTAADGSVRYYHNGPSPAQPTAGGSGGRRPTSGPAGSGPPSPDHGPPPPPGMVTSSDGTPLERFAFDDACGPIFLDATGRIRQGATAPLGPIRWMAPEALWEPDLRFYLGPDSIYSPDLGTIVSEKVVKFKAGAELSGSVNRGK